MGSGRGQGCVRVSHGWDQRVQVGIRVGLGFGLGEGRGKGRVGEGGLELHTLGRESEYKCGMCVQI